MAKKTKKERPGFVVYFELRRSLELMNKEQIAELFMAMMNYCEYGELPKTNDILIKMCFNGLRPRLDSDRENYYQTIAQRTYAVYVRESKKMGREPLDYDSWTNINAAKDEAIGKLSGDIGR